MRHVSQADGSAGAWRTSLSPPGSRVTVTGCEAGADPLGAKRPHRDVGELPLGSGCGRLQSGRDSVSALCPKATLCPGVRWPPAHCQWLLLGQHHLGYKALEDATLCEGFTLMMLRVCPRLCRPRGQETALVKTVTAQGPALLKSPECTSALGMKKKLLG